MVAYLLDQAEAFVEPTSSSTGSSTLSHHQVDSHPGGYMYMGKLLTATDRDGKTPIALAKKNKQMAVEVLLRNAMKQYVTNPSSSRNSSKFLNGQWRTELSTSSINVSFHIMDVTGLLKFFIVGSSSC